MSERIVSVTEVDFDGSVGIGVGIDVDTEQYVRFAGDHRPMAQIANALSYGEDVEVEVPEWSILSVWDVEVEAEEVEWSPDDVSGVPEFCRGSMSDVYVPEPEYGGES